MTFREYYKKPIKESPDVVYSPLIGTKLTWYTKGAQSFGTIKGLKGITPFFIYSIKDSVTHFEMIQNMAIKLEITYHEKFLKKHKENDLDMLQELFEYALLTDALWRVASEDVGRLAHEIVNHKNIMRMIKSRTFLDWMDAFTVSAGEEEGETEIQADLRNPVRTELYRNSGRIWKNVKVISFWLTEDQLTPQILDDTFNKLKVTDKNRYYIDAVNIKELDKEETKKKKLPSYHVFKSKKSTPPKNDRVLSDDEIRRTQALMAKQHGVAGAQKAKYKDELPEVGAKKYAMQMPLDVRQKMQTSESKKA